MGYSTYRTWVKSKLDTLSNVYVYDHPTDEYNYPAIIMKVGPSIPNAAGETNVSIERRYELELDLIVGTNEILQNASDAERIFALRLDDIIELFDAKENRHPNDNAVRVRNTRVTIKNIVSPDPKRIATITLEFVKRNS